MAASAPRVKVQIPEKLLPIFNPKPFKILHGGRGGAKSHTVAQTLVLMSMRAKHRILCVREVQKSLAESSKQVIEDYIERLGLGRYFDIVKDEIRCLTTGSTFRFSGLKDHTAASIKSFEGATIVWVEEAHSVTAHSWNILIPTIVRTNGAEIWATFNPDQESDYVYDRFVKHSDPDAWVCQINWKDNPWFNEAMNVERLKLKAMNDDLYQHVWEGKCRSLSGLLFKRHWFKRYNPGQEPTHLNKYMAGDYAGGPDPDNPDSVPDWTELGVWGADTNLDLWALDWWSGQEDPAQWIRAWLALIRRHRPLFHFEEKGPILRSLHGSMELACRETQTFVMRYPLNTAGSKADRAMGFAARAAAGTVHIPNNEWGDRLINQLCAFNGQDGRTDDMVDVCSLLGRGLELVWAALKPAEKPDPAAILAAPPKVSDFLQPASKPSW